MIGWGVLTIRSRFADVPPPGAGLETDTWMLPTAATSPAVTGVSSLVLLTKMVPRDDPPKRACEPATKFVPLIVKVKAALPAFTFDGAREVSVGAALEMGRSREFEVPPPGGGVTTAIFAVPAVAMSVSRTAMSNWVALTKVVVRELELSVATDWAVKFESVIVRVNAAPPVVAVAGASEVSAGSPLLTLKMSVAETPPPG